MATPKDFAKPLRKSIAAALRTGQWRLMPWNGMLVVLPRTVNSWKKGGIDNSSGACVLWHPTTGCALPAAQRPTQCRELEPEYVAFGLDQGYQCTGIRGRHSAYYAEQWRPHQVELLAALRVVEAEEASL